MRKRFLYAGVVAVLISSMTLSSCIGSFKLTGNVMNWNNHIGSKFVNELVFFAFWVLPVYEVTALADILVINSIEFWSGRNPLTASVKAVDTDHGRYLITCDGKGYTVTHEQSGESYRLDFIESTQTWELDFEGARYPLMTFVDSKHVKMAMPGGCAAEIELSEEGVLAYENAVKGSNFLQAYAL